MKRRVWLLILTAVLILPVALWAAASTQSDSAAARAGTTAAATPAAPTTSATPASSTAASDPFIGVAEPNEPFDERFIDEMVMHHQCAIASAQGMIANSDRPELRDLAQRIITAQQQQIDQMKRWRQEWYGSSQVPTYGMQSMMGMMGMMSSMMGSTGGMMGGMMASNGGGMMSGTPSPNQNTDRMFLAMMIPHHQLAIDMSQAAVQQATHPELKQLAQEIITGQSAEITEMEGYLKNWYGVTLTHDQVEAEATAMRQMMRAGMGH